MKEFYIFTDFLENFSTIMELTKEEAELVRKRNQDIPCTLSKGYSSYNEALSVQLLSAQYELIDCPPMI